MRYAIETRGLFHRVSKRFEIRDLAMSVPEGSIYGFLGPNGSGKTTTIQLLLALRRPGAGSITVLGESMPANAARVLAGIGFVPERPHLYPGLSVGESLRYHAAFYPSWDDGRARSLLAQFRLQKDAQVGKLSKGEMGQLMILLALSQTPALLVLDEPTEGLDPVVRRDITAALMEYVSERGATVLISSHLVHELEGVCDWVGLMDDGRLETEMPMRAFKAGLKRLRVADAPAVVEDAPFAVLAREPSAFDTEVESWLVRGWQPPMREYVESTGARLREVVDLDLEEGFVELLRTFRAARG